MSCRPIYQDVREVGKTIKASKKLFVWKFNIDKKDYTIELFNSMLSGKKKINQNGQIIYENGSFQGAFNFSFSIGKNSCSIVQHGDKFELRINNQAFSHLYENKLQNRHFKTDDTGNSGDRGGSGSRNRESRKERERKPKADKKNNNDEDADLQRAIEESKKTAEREERARVAAEKLQGADVIGKKKKQPAGGNDFDFGGGGIADAGDVNDINGFDFGADAGPKEEKKDDEFDFNFGAGKAEKPKEPEPVAGGGDLMDLLGGLDMNAGTQPAQPEAQGQNALDFFNDDSAKNDGALGAAANGQQQAAGDPFNFNAPQAQQQQAAEPEKPKGFVPNPGLFNMGGGGQFGTAAPQQNQGNPFGQGFQQNQFQTGYQQNQGFGNQQQMGYGQQQNQYQQHGTQQQMYGQQQNNQNYGQGQFGTQQQPSNNFGGFDNNQNQNNFGTQQQQFAGFNDNNNQQQQQFSGFDNQQQQQPSQQQNSNQSTPFDMF